MNGSNKDALIFLILILVAVFGAYAVYPLIKGDTVTYDSNRPGTTIEFHQPTPTPTACIIINGKQVCGPVTGG